MDKQMISATVAANIQTLMNKLDISSANLARKCNLPSGTISKILKGAMNITIPMAVTLAKGLDTNVSELLVGLENSKSTKTKIKKSYAKDSLIIGILSIDNKRMTCIQDKDGEIIGTSEIYEGLDLAESTTSLMALIKESIQVALPLDQPISLNQLKNSTINLVMQSYEFEETQKKFQQFMKRQFKTVRIIPDWQITYFAAFDNKPGISLVIDKGVSLSYLLNDQLKKIGGWKFPVYDLGGENWIGLETIHHTIEAIEGYIEPTELSRNVIAKFNGKIEKITEACFKGGRDPDIYCSFCEIALRAYAAGDPAAKTIIEKGYKLISRSIDLADEITEAKLMITLNGSLADIYKPYLPKDRLIAPQGSTDQASLLASIDDDFLKNHGVTIKE